MAEDVASQSLERLARMVQEKQIVIVPRPMFRYWAIHNIGFEPNRFSVERGDIAYTWIEIGFHEICFRNDSVAFATR